jgi:hypothetical protein
MAKTNSNPAGAPTKLCPRCLRGSVMTGRQAQFNAKSVNGQCICTNCKMDEILAGLLG